MQQMQTCLERRGVMLVLSSPSGAGKTTIAREVLKQNQQLNLSVSVTTRDPRPGEEEGKDYFFVSEEQFQQLATDHALLEHAKVFDNYYGTPRQAVEKVLSVGQDVLFDIDWQGARQLRSAAPGDLVSIFILPPSMVELERRLYGRGQDSDEIIQGRMARAADEMSHWGEYDYIVINHDIEESIAQVQAILMAERQKRQRLTGLPNMMADMVI